MRLFFVVLVALVSSGRYAPAETVEQLLTRAALPDEVVLEDVKTYLHERVPPLVVPETLADWETQSAALRQRYLDEIVLKGVPATWTEGDVKVEYVEDIETGQGYRIRKLRYEAIPGMWIPALLYEPHGEAINLPGVLNVNGHYDEGKVRDEEQIRCINFTKRGVVNIHPEWFRCGELKGVDNDHARSAYLDLVGIRGLSIFHLALKRAMDVLENHPRTDPSRLAMSGLSGGGWQTAVFSAVDERVSAIVPVAGHGAMGVRIDNGSDIGDLEQVPMDLLTVADYTHLTALFAPRPALLIYNAHDNCCFQAARTLPAIYDPVRPVYGLYGAASDFRFHINEDPGDHNYGQDNRIQFYKFVDEYLVPESDWGGVELPTEGEILPVEQTNVGIPENNATIVGTAIEVAKAITRPAIPGRNEAGRRTWERETRGTLRALLRYTPIALTRVISELKNDNDTLSTAYRFVSQDWEVGAAGLLPGEASYDTVHLVLQDGGLPAAGENIASIAAAGHQTVALAPLFQDGTSPRSGNSWPYAMILNATGERALAVQAAQVAAVCDWFRSAKGARAITLHTTGVESGLIALTTAALNPELVDGVETTDMPDSLIDVLEARGKYTRTPSLFNFGFLQYFDLDTLHALGN